MLLYSCVHSCKCSFCLDCCSRLQQLLQAAEVKRYEKYRNELSRPKCVLTATPGLHMLTIFFFQKYAFQCNTDLLSLIVQKVLQKTDLKFLSILQPIYPGEKSCKIFIRFFTGEGSSTDLSSFSDFIQFFISVRTSSTWLVECCNVLSLSFLSFIFPNLVSGERSCKS